MRRAEIKERVNTLMDTAQPNMATDILNHFQNEWENLLADKMVGAYTAVFDEFEVKTHGDAKMVNPAITKWENQKLKEALCEWMKEIFKEEE